MPFLRDYIIIVTKENIMRVVTFGEIMLRLQPFGYKRLSQADSYEATYGGAEANVAAALSCMGVGAAFVTKLPKNEIGQNAIDSLRKVGVDTSHVVRGGDRTGLYYCEKGASQRPSKVVYDRAGSAISLARRNEFDWKKIFDGADWFHFTGITPALSDELAEICLDAAKNAKKLGLTVSCDPNYRAKLWSKEKASKVLMNLMPFVDVCITNVPQVLDVFGATADSERELADKLIEKFGFKTVAFTRRESISASDNVYSGALYTADNFAESRAYTMHIVDRVGGGDAFAAGLIYATEHGFDLQKSVDFAVAAAVLKHSIEGDVAYLSVGEIEQLAGGDGTGRVQR